MSNTKGLSLYSPLQLFSITISTLWEEVLSDLEARVQVCTGLRRIDWGCLIQHCSQNPAHKCMCSSYPHMFSLQNVDWLKQRHLWTILDLESILYRNTRKIQCLHWLTTIFRRGGHMQWLCAWWNCQGCICGRFKHDFLSSDTNPCKSVWWDVGIVDELSSCRLSTEQNRQSLLCATITPMTLNGLGHPQMPSVGANVHLGQSSDRTLRYYSLKCCPKWTKQNKDMH